MNGEHAPAYGWWPLVLFNAGLIIFFAYTYFRPRTKQDWRTLGTFSAFVVALFAEMYGFPLTIYVLSGWLQTRFPGLDLLTHDAGHLWYALLGFKGDPHFNPIHIASNLIIVGGFFLLAASWRVLWEAQTQGKLADTGPYRKVRHPQYIAFILIMVGFLLQWPTLLTLLLFPILVFTYVRLAYKEERDVEAQLGEAWREYVARTPGWIPRFG